MSMNFDETVRFQSEKRREWIREIRGERLQGIAEGASSAPRLASSSAASSPGRNKCPGTHCSLIRTGERRQFLPDLPQRDKRKDGEEDRMRVKEEKRSGRLVGAAKTSKERAELRRLQRKNLNKLSLLKK